jgi:hypothetical protein
MKPIMLTPDEVKDARRIAAGRKRANRRTRKGTRFDARHDVDLVGALAEVAFGKAFGLEPDRTEQARSAYDDVDFSMGGFLIDVKGTTCLNRPSLFVPFKKRQDRVDVYVLVTVDHEPRSNEPIECELVGWARKEDLMRKGERHHKPQGSYWQLRHEKLRRDIDTIPALAAHVRPAI